MKPLLVITLALLIASTGALPQAEDVTETDPKIDEKNATTATTVPPTTTAAPDTSIAPESFVAEARSDPGVLPKVNYKGKPIGKVVPKPKLKKFPVPQRRVQTQKKIQKPVPKIKAQKVPNKLHQVPSGQVPQRRDSPGYAPPSYEAPKREVIIKQAGPSQIYGWVGHGSGYNAPHHLENPFPADLPKWILENNNIFEAGLLYPGPPSSDHSSYSAPPSPPASYSPPENLGETNSAPTSYNVPVIPSSSSYNSPTEAPEYEAPAPAYESPAPSYDAPVPEYNAPAPPVPEYNAPAPPYESPAPSYNAPAPTAPAYNAPAPSAPAYNAPAPPAPAYSAPAPAYNAASPTYNAPTAPSYDAPAPAYNAPAPANYVPVDASGAAVVSASYSSVGSSSPTYPGQVDSVPATYAGATFPPPFYASVTNPPSSYQASQPNTVYGVTAPPNSYEAVAPPDNYGAAAPPSSYSTYVQIPPAYGAPEEASLTYGAPAQEEAIPVSYGEPAEEDQSIYNLYSPPQTNYGNQAPVGRPGNFPSYNSFPGLSDELAQPVESYEASAPLGVYEVPTQVEEGYQGPGGQADPEVFYIFYENDDPATAEQNEYAFIAPPEGNQFIPPKDIQTIYVPPENAINVPDVYGVDLGTSFGYGDPQQEDLESVRNSQSGFTIDDPSFNAPQLNIKDTLFRETVVGGLKNPINKLPIEDNIFQEDVQNHANALRPVRQLLKRPEVGEPVEGDEDLVGSEQVDPRHLPFGARLKKYQRKGL